MSAALRALMNDVQVVMIAQKYSTSRNFLAI
ncbi:hypothetical protein NSE_0403 [Neorickettsia sennetsu str. Miyayama]|uniref:Uncharacterized protein n=1 Tax=Ehrlichia sennetsu (strain ATCC VR-367 / Miyayama) TaxID=222891 RepID=Q2GE06_EHRS3|nr:hypothetical protein NSE_0403 [Neorickettsia sennetsu str. Miyayama]